MITACLDSIAQETVRFKGTLLSAGVEVEFKRFEDATHGFTVLTEKQGRRRKDLHQTSLEAWQPMMDLVNKHM